MAGSAATRPTPGRGRGRPPRSVEAVERRRQDIIEAAYEIFSEQGYHATGIADIAARLDIGHGTFYRYFENKRDILDHVFDYGVTRLLKLVVTERLPEAQSREELREQLTTLGNRIFTEIVDKDPRLPRMILLEVTAIDAELLQRVLGLIETVNALLEPFIENGIRRGFLNPRLDSASTARALTGCIIGGLFATVRAPMAVAERGRYIDTVVSLICDNAPAGTPTKVGARTRTKAQRATPKKSASS
jgi:AcrR family transcriptional regulator